jgi:predicted acetyltransferase
MTIHVRPMADDEWPSYYAVAQEAFNSSSAQPERMDRIRRLTELDRALVALDSDLMIGRTSILTFTMTVPGGTTPVAGVTDVAVLPSHRRRGALTALMRRQLHDLHESGEAVAALYASEAGIYGRYGYGRAADSLFFRIPKWGSAFVSGAPADPALRVRVASPADSLAEFQQVFDSVRLTRPGMYARIDDAWHLEVLADDDQHREGAGPLRCVIVEDDSGPRGYALFRVKQGTTDHDVPDGEVRLRELFACDPAAYALTWRNVLDRDLCSRVFAWSRPADDPILHLLAEPRHLNAGWLDELWVRLVDVDRALAARAYAVPADLVIEVRDEFCPWNAGRWRLITAKQSCERTDDPPDLTLPVEALGAAYLGGQAIGGRVAAGMATEHRPGAARELSAAMSWDPKPWAGLVF